MSSSDPDQSPELVTLKLYTQSIGRGVPEEARQALEKVQAILADIEQPSEIVSWGIEGEKRLCVQLNAQLYAQQIKQVSEIGASTELFSMELTPAAQGDCGAR